MVPRSAYQKIFAIFQEILKIFAESISIPLKSAHHFSFKPDCNKTAKVPSFLCTFLSVEVR